MNPEQERQAQAKRDEDSIRALDEDLRFLRPFPLRLPRLLRYSLLCLLLSLAKCRSLFPGSCPLHDLLPS
jgi:hypothetical protein